MHYFSLHGAYCEPKGVAGIRELANTVLHVRFEGSVEGAMISKQEDVDGVFSNLGSCMKPPEDEDDTCTSYSCLHSTL